jgi:hypothetical protein
MFLETQVKQLSRLSRTASVTSLVFALLVNVPAELFRSTSYIILT